MRDHIAPPKRALVLGAYGFIGAACAARLKAAGYHVTGLGRSANAARSCAAADDWIIADITRITPEDWAGHLQNTDVIINASGALQDGLRDNLHAIHVQAIINLCSALPANGPLLIQISAAGASTTAGSDFLRTKARGDAHIAAHVPRSVILRPALVIGPQAYGGTALLRAAAAVPLLRPDILPDSPIQTLHVDDLASAVLACATGEIAAGTIADLGEAHPHPMRDILTQFRQWLGFRPWRARLPLPPWLIRPISLGADLLGWLGWRSPLRRNALRSLADGITVDTSAWTQAGGSPVRPLSETLASLPAHAQERGFARLYLLLPLAIATLALFWLASGLIGLWQAPAAQALLTDRGLSPGFASAAVLLGSLIDIALGVAVMVRRWTRWACLGMILTALGYLAASLLAAPDLWADPLGPMVKVFPAITLALITAALIEDR